MVMSHVAFNMPRLKQLIIGCSGGNDVCGDLIVVWTFSEY